MGSHEDDEKVKNGAKILDFIPNVSIYGSFYRKHFQSSFHE
jgi:hypothetical protein